MSLNSIRRALTFGSPVSWAQGQLTQDWLTIFDLKYINDVMLGGLRRASGVIRDYCEKLELKAFASAQVRNRSREAQVFPSTGPSAGESLTPSENACI